MSTLTRWFVDFTVPTAEFGFNIFPLVDFVLYVNVGPQNEELEGVDRHSTVLASICELATLPGQPLDFPFIGAAPMEIRNIAPRDDGIVEMWVHIEWLASALNGRINFVVING